MIKALGILRYLFAKSLLDLSYWITQRANAINLPRSSKNYNTAIVEPAKVNDKNPLTLILSLIFFLKTNPSKDFYLLVSTQSQARCSSCHGGLFPIIEVSCRKADLFSDFYQNIKRQVKLGEKISTTTPLRIEYYFKIPSSKHAFISIS